MKPFAKWVHEQGGYSVVCKLLGVSRAALHLWFAQQTGPKLVTAQYIVKLAKGAVTYDDIINETKGTPAERKRAAAAKGA